MSATIEPRPVRRNLRTLLRGARRGRAAVAVGALSSAGNVMVSLMIARAVPIAEVGQFVLAFGVYIFVLGLSRAVVTDAGLTEDPARTPPGAGRACLIGVLAAVAAGAAGLALGSTYLIILGPLLPGLVLYDYRNCLALGVGTPRRAVIQESVWTALTLAGVVLAAITAQPLLCFAVWAASGSLLGHLCAGAQGGRAWPVWAAGRQRNQQALSFGIQFLLASGSAQLGLFMLAAMAGTATVGVLGAARTVLGPVNVLAGAVTLLAGPYLARRAIGDRVDRLRAAAMMTGAAVAVVLPLGLLASMLPGDVGRSVLGDNWAAAKPVVAILAVETALAVATAMPFAGHRVARAGRRVVLLGVVLGPLRVGVLTLAGLHFAATGIAWVLAAAALLGAVVWWFSYLTLIRTPGAAESPTFRLRQVSACGDA